MLVLRLIVKHVIKVAYVYRMTLFLWLRERQTPCLFSCVSGPRFLAIWRALRVGRSSWPNSQRVEGENKRLWSRPCLRGMPLVPTDAGCHAWMRCPTRITTKEENLTSFLSLKIILMCINFLFFNPDKLFHLWVRT